MKIKTQGKCLSCGEACTPLKAKTHLLKCIGSSPIPAKSKEEVLLIRVSGTGQPNLYWMFIAVPKNVSLDHLDQFLRDIWLECCGHLSEFTIGGRHYMSHTESGGRSQSMKHKVSQLLSPKMEFEYVYDMGSSTDLELKVIENLQACPQKNITLLMRNDPPLFFCAACKKASKIICSFCGETTCAKCKKNHPCVVREGEAYMMMPLVNSPRAGICGYEG